MKQKKFSLKYWQVISLQVLMFISGFFAATAGKDYLSIAPMVFLAFPAYYGLISAQPKKGLLFIFLLSIYATAIEAISITTGFPYGFFTYGGVLGSKLFGVVPWAVSFGWVPLVIGVVVVARIYVKKKEFIYVLSVLFLVFVDLLLDPGAVALGFWSWITTSSYYTVPFVNYLGWLFSSIIGVGLFMLIFKKKEVATIPVYANLTLVLGIMFWVAVTLFSGMYLATFFGVIAVMVVNYSYVLESKLLKKTN